MKKSCFSLLKDEYVRDEDYEHAKKMMNEFRMKTVGDYHDFYLKQMFCYWKMYLSSLEKYSSKIDPCHYFSSPGLSWNTMS